MTVSNRNVKAGSWLPSLGRAARSADTPLGLTGTVIIYAAVLTLGVVMFFPFLWVVLTAVKTENQLLYFKFLPSPATLEPFLRAWGHANFPRLYFNSAVVAIIATVSTLALASLAGYGFATYRFRGREAAFVAILATMMVPFQVTMIPLYLISVRLGLQNSYVGILLPQLCSAFGVFLTRQFMQTIPQDMFDSARVDGCGEGRIYATIALPLLKPALAALGVFTFMGSWDSFISPLIVTESADMRTLPIGIALVMQRAGYRVPYNELMGVSLIGMVPIVILFAALQRHFVQGIVMSGMKY